MGFPAGNEVEDETTIYLNYPENMNDTFVASTVITMMPMNYNKATKQTFPDYLEAPGAVVLVD